MNRLAAVTVVFALAWPAAADAHRLDEYLQAVRVDVTRGRVALELDLTPGVSVAADLFSRIDADGDHRVSGPEAEAYARRVLGELVVRADGRALTLVLERVEVPTREALADGMGTIRIDARAEAPASPGRHRFEVRNDHEPERSAYLVNALLPRDPGVSIASQIRDPKQREVRIEYDVQSPAAAHAWWGLTGVVSMAALVLFRRRERPRP